MVATELAVFLRVDGLACTAGGSLEELLESQENGLLNFLPVGAGAGGGGAAAAGAASWALAAGGLFDRESFAGGDQGIGGRAFVMLLKDMVFDAFSAGGGELFSGGRSVGLSSSLLSFGSAELALRSRSRCCNRVCSRIIIEIDRLKSPCGDLGERSRRFCVRSVCSLFLGVWATVCCSSLRGFVTIVGICSLPVGQAFNGLVAFGQGAQRSGFNSVLERFLQGDVVSVV
jgi:hypothetical protein